jgi:hypothetical protein
MPFGRYRRVLSAGTLPADTKRTAIQIVSPATAAIAYAMTVMTRSGNAAGLHTKLEIRRGITGETANRTEVSSSIVNSDDQSADTFGTKLYTHSSEPTADGELVNFGQFHPQSQRTLVGSLNPAETHTLFIENDEAHETTLMVEIWERM